MQRILNRINRAVFEKRQRILFGDSVVWPQVISAFPAFASRNYQLYFPGQLVSLIGTWMQQVAEGWLVFSLTHSPFWVGVVAALNDLPILFFVLFGGVIVDRFSKKHILIFTQIASMILAFTLGILTLLGKITVIQMCFLAFLSGIVNALDMPGRQAFIIEMVGKENLSSAIALNSATWNIARIIGPAIASVLIVAVGTGGAFVINGFSFLAVITALLCIKTTYKPKKIDSHPFAAITEGLSYSFSHTVIKKLLLFTAVSTIFGWSYAVMIPVMVRSVFHQDASALGFLYSAAGAGAVAATIFISMYSKKINKFLFITGGNIIFSVSLLLFSFINTLSLALIALFFVGFGLIMQFSTMNSTIQHLVQNHIRGRVMSIYTLMFLGMGPIGSFQIGFVSDHLGPQIAIRIGACIVLFFGIILFLQRNKFTVHSTEAAIF